MKRNRPAAPVKKVKPPEKDSSALACARIHSSARQSNLTTIRQESIGRTQIQRMSNLYALPLRATRSGPLFNAHPYPTKISAESVALLIACHTKPGDLIFDGFGGSGTTALAALLCSKPSPELKAQADKRGLKPLWGPRRAILYELGGLGSFIASTFCSRPSAQKFLQAALQVLREAERRIGWIYSANDPLKNPGVARYFIWSDNLRCPDCKSIVSFWSACVHLEPAQISDSFCCPECGHACSVDQVLRVYDKGFDDFLRQQCVSKSRTLVRVDGITGNKRWSRPPTAHDLDLFDRIRDAAVPKHFPSAPMMGRGGVGWGDLWRAGYHDGMTHVHHFYTRRNLIALSVLHELVEDGPANVRDALRLWVSSYNSSHSTLMTRVVAKAGHDELVLTSSQPGVLYVSGLPVEKNVLLGLRRKLKTFTQAFAILGELEGDVQIVQGSSTHTHLPDTSVDYVFTDPPFGGNIPYSEVNFIAEAWLGKTTNNTDEVIISSAQDKTVDQYEKLLERAFAELRRILKPNGKVTVAFHSTQADVWKALVCAYTSAGFSLECSGILDKKQGSFKQITTSNVAKGDPLILLRRRVIRKSARTDKPQVVIRSLISLAEKRRTEEPDEWTSKRLYSRFVEYYLQRNTSPPIDAAQFYTKLAIAQSDK